MKIYVTGAAGMIGSNLVRSLVAKGHSVVGVDNFWRGTRSNLEGIEGDFTFFEEDLTDSGIHCFDELGDNDVLIHLADIVAGIGYVFANEWPVFQKNLLINTAIASVVAGKKPSKLIYVGTACSYPQGLQRSVESSVLKEDDKFPADPESGYGWSKLMGEIEYRLLAKSGETQLVVLDLHNVYGWPCEFSGATSQVIPALINRALETPGSLTVWGDGTQGRAFVHVDDVVSALESAVSYEGSEGTIMIGPSSCTSIGEIAQIVVSDSRTQSDAIEFDTSKPTGDIGRFADPSRAERELGWKPSVDIHRGISDLIGKIDAAKRSQA
ncbi:MAG: NAD-dependent epimerase/dehydratase family protein [Verrucomicrobiales bacterium]|nr:NAD-dependent epimerase/dehydratase family protein [Verrucomicrobiales bacterium]